MSVWAAYLGPDGSALHRALGEGARLHRGAGFSLGVRDGGGEPVTLTVAADGRALASIGCDAEAGCSVTAAPGGPSLTLACDPFGLHGVFHARTDDGVWCASDLRVLQRLPGVAGEVDAAALHGYLCFSYVPTPRTVLAGVSSVPAGSRLTVTPTDQQCEPEAVWCARPPQLSNEQEAASELLHRLRAAVARQADRISEAGVFLSGGLDSSLVAALLVEIGVQVHLFTLDFGPPFDVELPYARRVAEHLGRPLRVVPARPAQVGAALEATAAALQQPFGDAVTVPLYLLGQAAAREVGVVFNGEGGDQLFGGWANKPMVAAELYAGTGYDREAAYLATYHRFYGLTDRYYTPRARAATAAVDAGAWVRPALNAEGFAGLLHRLRAANLRLKGAQNIAPRAVQLAAAHGLRLRSPFFDRALAEWTFGLPPEWLLHGACEKYLLKRAAEPLLPPEIVWREKRGMGVPATEWLSGALRREAARRLSRARLARDGWFDPAAAAALCRGDGSPAEFRRRRWGERLWALLMFQVWNERQWAIGSRQSGAGLSLPAARSRTSP